MDSELLLPDPGRAQKIALSTLPETLMSYEEYEKTFYPIHVKDLTSQSKKSVYGIPLMVDGLVMIINEDLLKKAGIATIPTNWDEMIAAASQVTVKGKDGSFVPQGLQPVPPMLSTLQTYSTDATA
jgi:ABC-type glycerol-3-phosphate transport system substrate-binding protein